MPPCCLCLLCTVRVGGGRCGSGECAWTSSGGFMRIQRPLRLLVGALRPSMVFAQLPPLSPLLQLTVLPSL